MQTQQTESADHLRECFLKATSSSIFLSGGKVDKVHESLYEDIVQGRNI